ncbi:hypothetical protein [Polaromonas sp.]|uniref:hypothetical protein n=1 Tax=Polaromonas sp. TaxID=1869339 RepID=UPI00286CC2E2|nr:hypothetical protein [Polaromonas sp.]
MIQHIKRRNFCYGSLILAASNFLPFNSLAADSPEEYSNGLVEMIQSLRILFASSDAAFSLLWDAIDVLPKVGVVLHSIEFDHDVHRVVCYSSSVDLAGSYAVSLNSSFREGRYLVTEPVQTTVIGKAGKQLQVFRQEISQRTQDASNARNARLSQVFRDLPAFAPLADRDKMAVRILELAGRFSITPTIFLTREDATNNSLRYLRLQIGFDSPTADLLRLLSAVRGSTPAIAISKFRIVASVRGARFQGEFVAPLVDADAFNAFGPSESRRPKVNEKVNRLLERRLARNPNESDPLDIHRVAFDSPTPVIRD